MGTYFRCYFIADGLSKCGYQVTMICASGKSFDLLIRRQKINKHFIIVTLPRIKYHQYFTGQALLRLPLTILYILFARYDLLYAFTVAQPQVGVPAWIAKKIRGKKLIVDWDDLWGGGFAKVHGGIVELVLTWSERNFVKLADEVTFVSQRIGEEIEKIDLNLKKIKVENGANSEEIMQIDQNLARKRLGMDPQYKYLLSVGNTYTASFGLMLKAFSLAKKKIMKLRLILVGSLDIKAEYHSLFESLKKEVIIFGPRPYSEISFFLGASDVLLLPMDDDPIEYARFPMRFGDYLCAGRPIASNAVGEVKYYLEKYKAGLTCRPDSASEFGNIICRIILDHRLAEKVSKNSRSLAEGVLSRRQIIRKVKKLIDALIE